MTQYDLVTLPCMLRAVWRSETRCAALLSCLGKAVSSLSIWPRHSSSRSTRHASTLRVISILNPRRRSTRHLEKQALKPHGSSSRRRVCLDGIAIREVSLGGHERICWNPAELLWWQLSSAARPRSRMCHSLLGSRLVSLLEPGSVSEKILNGERVRTGPGADGMEPKDDQALVICVWTG